MLISQCGIGKPLIHNVGKINECSTSKQESIAVHKREGFHETRNEIIKIILELNSN